MLVHRLPLPNTPTDRNEMIYIYVVEVVNEYDNARNSSQTWHFSTREAADDFCEALLHSNYSPSELIRTSSVLWDRGSQAVQYFFQKEEDI